MYAGLPASSLDTTANLVNNTARNIGPRARPENKSALSINAVPKANERNRMPKSNLPKPEAGFNEPAVLSFAKRKWFLSETKRYLEGLARCVRECKRVDESSNFSRWLLFSGVFCLVKEEPSLRSEASQLYALAEDVAMACGELYKCGKANPNYSRSDIEQINAKLDLLLNKKPEPDNAFGTGVGGPELSAAGKVGLQNIVQVEPEPLKK